MTRLTIQGFSGLNAVQYQAVFRYSHLVPTPERFFDLQALRFEMLGVGVVDDYRHLREFIPEGELNFMIRPAMQANSDSTAWMEMVRMAGLGGEALIDIGELKDQIDVPEEAHLLTGVNDGEALLGQSAGQACEILLSAGRSPFGIWDGICFASLFPFSLVGRGLALAGCYYSSTSSHYGEEGPGICLGPDSVPRLVEMSEIPDAIWAPHSCFDRLGLDSDS